VTHAQLTDEEREFNGPFLPVGRFGPYPERLREQFEGVIRRFRPGSQWREASERFGAGQTVYNRFMWWRDAGVFQALLEEAIAEAARRDEIDMSRSAWTAPRSGPVMTRPACGSARRS
jgi:transposase